MLAAGIRVDSAYRFAGICGVLSDLDASGAASAGTTAAEGVRRALARPARAPGHPGVMTAFVTIDAENIQVIDGVCVLVRQASGLLSFARALTQRRATSPTNGPTPRDPVPAPAPRRGYEPARGASLGPGASVRAGGPRRKPFSAGSTA